VAGMAYDGDEGAHTAALARQRLRHWSPPR
jgi:hypothetical protein